MPDVIVIVLGDRCVYFVNCAVTGYVAMSPVLVTIGRVCTGNCVSGRGEMPMLSIAVDTIYSESEKWPTGGRVTSLPRAPGADAARS